MKNWRTTLIGAVLAALLSGLTIMQTGTIDVKTVLLSVGIAFLGYVAKDAGVSGIVK